MPLSYVHYAHQHHRHYAAQIATLYHQAVHAQSGGFYSQQQCAAWSSAPRSHKFWQLRLKYAEAWLALDHQQCIGFIQLESRYRERGYVSCLYVAPAYQRRGVAATLIQQAQAWSRTAGWLRLTTDASLQSQSVFARQGFVRRHKSYQEKRGQQLLGFKMSCDLSAH